MTKETVDEHTYQCMYFAILQSRNPTCGVHTIYDGSFSSTLIPGQGLFARALIESGYTVLDTADIERITDMLSIKLVLKHLLNAICNFFGICPMKIMLTWELLYRLDTWICNQLLM